MLPEEINTDVLRGWLNFVATNGRAFCSFKTTDFFVSKITFIELVYHITFDLEEKSVL